MAKFNKRSLVTMAASKIWADFVWLWNHTDTPYASAEYVINKNYSVFAFEESDDGENAEDEKDKWITITLEKYNDRGKCVNDFVVTVATKVITRPALSAGLSNLFKAFENKFESLDALEPDGQDWQTPIIATRELSINDMNKIKWLFNSTDFSNAQIGKMFDVSAVKISKIRMAECGMS